jgi:hypothetical protein
MGILGIAWCVVLGVSSGTAQQIHRNGFETSKIGWLKGGFDAPYEEKTHAISDQVAHEGRHSEYIQFVAQSGTFIHYAYATGKAIIGEELSAGLWLRANRPGMQLLARVVLPHERDPRNLDQLLTTYIKGDVYQQVGQWQHLQLGRPVQLARQQQQLLQAQNKRPIDFTDAHIDGLVLNVYGGPGPTDVWIDDVEIGPIVAGDRFIPAIRPVGPTEAQPTKINVPRPERKGLLAEFTGERLKVGGRPFFFRGIYVTDTPLEKLREARFNTIFLDQSANPALIREAQDRGLWVVPMLRVFGDDSRPLPPDELPKSLSRFGDADILFVDFGNTLAYEQATPVSRSVQAVKEFGQARVTGADVWDGMLPYSRTLNLVGVHRWPLMTTLELPRYREWLKQRRELANPGVFLWTSVQTHLPEQLAHLLHERSAAGSFDEPVGPQAEHLQLLTWTALSAGCRGLVFSSDRFLADSHHGRDRLLACALMNLELEMLEPLLAGADEAPEWVFAGTPDVKVAIVRSALGVLVLPVWQGPFAQFVPGQAAVGKLKIIVPPMPPSTQAWEVSPAEVHGLKTRRVAGGTEIELQNFGLTGAVVFTANNDLVARLQEQVKGRRQLAAQWAENMATYEFEKVMKVETQLEQQGHTLPDAQSLLADTQRRLKTARQLLDEHAFAKAYREAQAALRPVRILMRAQWEKAVRGMDSPVASPYAASFFTLPRHWQFMEQVNRATIAANVLPGGDFEGLPQRKEDAWHLEDPPSLDEVELIAQRVGEISQPEEKKPTPDDKEKATADKDRPGKPFLAEEPAKLPVLVKATPHEGKQCAMLSIQPKANRPAPAALERTVLSLNSPIVRLPPGTLVRVSGWVSIPMPIIASPDGALLYDSVGGDALAVRLVDPTPWKKFTLYRRVPASGTIQMTLALTGIGTVYFDDIRIEPLLPPEANPVPAAQVSGRN